MNINTIPSDKIGSVTAEIILSTDTKTGALTSEQLSTNFFQGNQELSKFGKEGSSVLWVTNPGLNKVEIETNLDAGNLLFWDGSKLNKLNVSNKTNTLLLNAVSDEWGLVLLGYENVSISQIKSIELLDTSSLNVNNYLNIYSDGDVEIDVINNSFTIGTGSGDKSVSTLGNSLVGNRDFLKSLGDVTEGSFIKFTGLMPGVYNFSLNIDTADTVANDSLYIYNGKELIKVAETLTNNVIESVEVIYDELTFIAVDVTNKIGTTKFIISNLNKTDDLAYTPPIRLNLIPDMYSGDIDFKENETRINTGTGDKSVETLSEKLGIDLSEYGTEGSYAIWENLTNGKYEITYSIYSSEDEPNNDKIYYFNGTNVTLLDARLSANLTNNSGTRFSSEIMTKEIEVINNKLTLIAMDTADKSGTTQFKITRIESVNSMDSNITNSEELNYIYSEPPNPIPANNKRLSLSPETAWNMGVLKPWETDSNSGIAWEQGYIYSNGGHNSITALIGGENVNEYVTFTLEEMSYLNFYHNNVIAEILDNNMEVIVSSNDGYDGNLKTQLEASNYYIHFSTDASDSELFTAQIHLSKSDPNFTDS